ncbi:hypothetical protein FVE85_0947 [Porphyridium purpureum]|uniref:Uncharacterized protein n=1 Tax=Porphyridium purpureum TaxID=35688 RepID=A0A5J4Z1L2_PORPP|nr:hypothetical protein FVE85_0947 [Porphyridium purpureum]|eukprot:POR9397..scf208_2
MDCVQGSGARLYRLCFVLALIKMAVSHSAGKRFALGLILWVLCMVMCYFALVAVFIFRKDVTMDHYQYNGWARVASRITGGMSFFLFVFFCMMPPSSLASILGAVLALAGQLMHLAILWSDLNVFNPKVVPTVTSHHPLWSIVPYQAYYAAAGLGVLCFVMLPLERVFGPHLGTRKPYYSPLATACAVYLVVLYYIYFFDRLIGLRMRGIGEGPLNLDFLSVGCLMLNSFALLCLIAYSRRVSSTPVSAAGELAKKSQ